MSDQTRALVHRSAMTVGQLLEVLSDWPADQEVVIGQPQCDARQDRYVRGVYMSPYDRCVFATGEQDWRDYP